MEELISIIVIVVVVLMLGMAVVIINLCDIKTNTDIQNDRMKDILNEMREIKYDRRMR